jgi:hypothetical protein
MEGNDMNSMNDITNDITNYIANDITNDIAKCSLNNNMNDSLNSISNDSLNNNMNDSLNSISNNNSNNEYKEYIVENLKQIGEKKSKYCTGHILDYKLVFNPNIRLGGCEKCSQDTINGRLPINEFEKKHSPKKTLIIKEIEKLEIVKREIKCAFTNLLNSNPNDLHVLFNLLYGMQENIITNDINRFQKEIIEMDRIEKLALHSSTT